MKKFFAMLLVLALTLSMAACSAEEATEKTELDPTTESTEITTTEAPTEEEPTEEPSTEGGIGFSGALGKTEGTVYENDMLGIGCELSSDWYLYNEAELATLIGLTADRINDEDISKIIEASGTAFLFYAMNNADSSTINIVLENTAAYGGALTEEDYIQAAMPALNNALPAAGFENLTVTSGTTQFAGEEHACIYVEAELAGMKVYEILVPIVLDGSVASVTICTFNENTCADLIATFYALAK